MSLLLSEVNARYWYDGDGTLVKGEINGVVTYYAGRHYHKEMDGENETVRKFYYAGSTQVAVRVNDTLTWVLSDHLGSTSVTANADGTLLSEMRYTAFWGGAAEQWCDRDALSIHRADQSDGGDWVVLLPGEVV